MISDYLERPKKKKKNHEREEVKKKPVRNFKIIDDDIDLNSLRPDETNEEDGMVDLLDPDARPVIVDDEIQVVADIPKKVVVKKVDMFTQNQWVSINLLEDENGDFEVAESRPDSQGSKGLFKKRGEKIKQENETDEELDLDSIPRKPRNNRDDDDDDLSPVRGRKPTIQDDDGDLSPVRARKSSPPVDETKVRVREKKVTEEEKQKKLREEKIKEKYTEWGKGLAQKKEREERLKNDVYEAEKPLARYKDDQDLERHLKEQEREDDPMLAYMRNKNEQDDDQVEGAVKQPKLKYRGPPAPPNRYNLQPGHRWDGVDRSNGFEKRYFDSIQAKKALQDEAYKWSTEDL